MGVLCDDFSADSYDAAAAMIDVLGGPRAVPGSGLQVVELKGLEPFVQLGKLE